MLPVDLLPDMAHQEHTGELMEHGNAGNALKKVDADTPSRSSSSCTARLSATAPAMGPLAHAGGARCGAP